MFTVVNLDYIRHGLPHTVERATLGEALRIARGEANRHGWPYQVVVYRCTAAEYLDADTVLPAVWSSLEDTAQTMGDLLLSRTDWHWLMTGSIHEFHGDAALQAADRAEARAIAALDIHRAAHTQEA